MQDFLSQMNWFDVAVISIVLVSSIFALFRGFIKAVFSFVTWVGAGATAAFFHNDAFAFFSGKISNEIAAHVVAGLAIFVAVFIILAIINAGIIHSLRKQSGGLIDRAIGLSFGVARGVVIVCLIFFSISMTSSMLHLGKNSERPGPDWFANAQTYGILDSTTASLLTLAPADMPQRLEEAVNKFKDMTVSAMGEQLEDYSSETKTLNPEQRQMMKKMLASLPDEAKESIHYEGGAAGISEFEKIEVFRKIVDTYREQIKSGKITPENIIPDEQLDSLSDSLNAGKPGGGESGETEDHPEKDVGYKDKNIKQLDRLIGDL